MDHHSRLIRLQAELESRRLDALLLTHLPNIRYLCGFSGSTGALLVGPKRAIFFTDGRYTVQAKSEVAAAKVVIARKSAIAAATAWLAAHTKQLAAKDRCRLGVEGHRLSLESYRWMSSQLGSRFRLNAVPPLVEQLRMVKDKEEIELLRAAADLGAGLFSTTTQAIQRGAKENEVAAEMEFAARRAGAEGMSFPTIVVSGEHSALPHGQPGARAIEAGGFVVCDFGVILSGYCSDRTRTVYVGRPAREARFTYEAVREAQAAAIAAVAPGRTVADVDGAARKVLQKQRLDRFFTHSTGHGVGIEIHEAPRIAAGQHEILRPGMVITIEPGVYIPERWGIRIEDMVVVTENGCEVLAPSSTELIAL